MTIPCDVINVGPLSKNDYTLTPITKFCLKLARKDTAISEFADLGHGVTGENVNHPASK